MNGFLSSMRQVYGLRRDAACCLAYVGPNVGPNVGAGPGIDIDIGNAPEDCLRRP